MFQKKTCHSTDFQTSKRYLLAFLSMVNAVIENQKLKRGIN